MLNGQGNYLKESKRGFPSPAASFFKLFGFAKIFPKSKLFARYYLGHLPENKNNEIEVLSGAFFMIRRIVLEKIGGFDEKFFMYGEDIDLSYRISQSGFRNYYLGEISITHFKGGSTSYDNKQLKTFYEAMNLFVKKHYEGKKPAWFVSFLYAGILVREKMEAIARIFR
jgi:GT2 family glycosyltransferase